MEGLSGGLLQDTGVTIATPKSSCLAIMLQPVLARLNWIVFSNLLAPATEATTGVYVPNVMKATLATPVLNAVNALLSSKI